MGPEDVLLFWLGPLGASGRADEEHRKGFWRKDPARDELIRQRFEALHAALMRGEHLDWLEDPRGRLAMIIVLDQFSRNMYRDTGRMFASDARALELAREGVDRGVDRQVGFDERLFYYMPFMHAEDPSVQDRSISLFQAWLSEVEGTERESIQGMLGYAERHRDIVRRFGRFPHRNAVLGRSSTQEEIGFLSEAGSSF